MAMTRVCSSRLYKKQVFLMTPSVCSFVFYLILRPRVCQFVTIVGKLNRPKVTPDRIRKSENRKRRWYYRHYFIKYAFRIHDCLCYVFVINKFTKTSYRKDKRQWCKPITHVTHEFHIHSIIRQLIKFVASRTIGREQSSWNFYSRWFDKISRCTYSRSLSIHINFPAQFNFNF